MKKEKPKAPTSKTDDSCARCPIILGGTSEHPHVEHQAPAYRVRFTWADPIVPLCTSHATQADDRGEVAWIARIVRG